MKLRLVPLVISIILTSAVLFGGWFAYHSVAMESPLSELVGSMDGVEEVGLKIDKEQVMIELKLAPAASLRDIYQTIVTEGRSLTGDREVVLLVMNDESATLDRLWSRVLFDVAQAMENRQYGRIPQLLEELTAEIPDVSAEAEIDEKNVYIRLTEGKQSKFIVLPRTPLNLGVWPNE